MTFARTRDPQLIRAFVTHPKIARWMFEDGADVAAYEPVLSERVWYVVAMDGRAPIGLFVFEPRTSVKYAVHVAIAPEQWPRGVEAFREVIQWAWEQIGMERIAGEIPADNAHALRLAKRAGFEIVGKEHGAYRRGGKLVDVRIVGLSREAACPSVH